MNTMKKFQDLPAILKDKNLDEVFIIGAAPSICNFNLELLDNKNCIFINSSVILHKLIKPSTSYFVSTDSLVLGWSYFKEALKCDYLILIDNDRFRSSLDNVWYFECDDDYEAVKNNNSNFIAGFSSMIAAIHIFSKLKSKKINIVGFDACLSVDGYMYFWQKCFTDIKPFFISNRNLISTDDNDSQRKNWNLQKSFMNDILTYNDIEVIYH